MPTNLIPVINAIVIAIGALAALSLLYFAYVSRREGERRAALRALIGAVMFALPYLAAASYGIIAGSALPSLMILVITAIALLILVLPFGNRLPAENEVPIIRHDERDVMFSRRALQVNSERFEKYYRANPQRRALDDKWRRRPGLMAKGARYYHPITTASARASFTAVESFHLSLDQPTNASETPNVEPGRISEYLRSWAKKLGAVSAGITQLHEYHLYSHLGRGDRYGEPVETDHCFALALTVEMDKRQLDSAPMGPILMESAQEYLQVGAIAVQIAEFIKQLGYRARAHIDGSYWVVCPLVARDAGLGEIGRMGLLMTPELGPRVRLAVVTTDMPLVPSQRRRDPTMIDFCRICLKCAEACPSNSIPFGDQEELDGVRRWKINAESCFTYWCTVGTDCGICMRSCPFSHPNSALHNLVRFGVKRSRPFRRLALALDDLFYGRIPLRVPVPSWIEEAYVESHG